MERKVHIAGLKCNCGEVHIAGLRCNCGEKGTHCWGSRRDLFNYGIVSNQSLLDDEISPFEVMYNIMCGDLEQLHDFNRRYLPNLRSLIRQKYSHST